ncbi:tetratricopeptide repeat protein [Clostridium sp. YIM B02569]|uniref:tetratricopeptide repeat protein n=1 Tax=Clostridium sp. YIM B02569 TaxID=2911967 RepID=UPI001EEA0B40|nr:tetratricopeptide repeat protein [Clostridium sp. YIM B02569]
MNYFTEGNKFYNMKDYEKAMDFYKKSASENLNTACSYYNCGVCLIKLKKFDDAIIMLNKAISLKHESKYFFNLGYCYVMKESLNTALRFFNLAWSIDPNDKDCEKAIDLIISKFKKAN